MGAITQLSGTEQSECLYHPSRLECWHPDLLPSSVRLHEDYHIGWPNLLAGVGSGLCLGRQAGFFRLEPSGSRSSATCRDPKGTLLVRTEKTRPQMWASQERTFSVFPPFSLRAHNSTCCAAANRRNWMVKTVSKSNSAWIVTCLITYVLTCTHTYKHTYLHVHPSVRLHVCMHLYMYMHTHKHIYIQMYILCINYPM